MATFSESQLHTFVQTILSVAFDHQLVLFGGAVRSIIRGEKPNDLDLAYQLSSDKSAFLQKLSEKQMHHSKIETVYSFMCESYTIQHKDTHIKIDLVDYKNLARDMDFDINRLNMVSFSTITLSPDTNLTIGTILENIHKKQFKILQIYDKIPKPHDRELNIRKNSEYIIRFVKLQARTVKLLSNGWKCLNDHEDH